MSGDESSVGALRWIRRKLRRWLLTEEERRLVNDVSELESDVSELESELSDVRGEWDGIRQALEDSDVWGEDIELDEVDILVVAGRQNHVSGVSFNDGLYVSGSEHVVADSYFDTGDSDE